MIAERVPGFDLFRLLTMTDRQIIAVFFPEKVPRKRPVAKTYKETFWKIHEGRGRTESQIQAAWNEYQRVTPNPLT